MPDYRDVEQVGDQIHAKAFMKVDPLGKAKIIDLFNIANIYNVAGVNPASTPNPANPSQSTAGQATAAFDPRQFQFALKLNW